VLTDTLHVASTKPAVSNVKISAALSAYPLHGTPRRLIPLLLLLLKASVLNDVMKSSDVADHAVHLG